VVESGLVDEAEDEADDVDDDRFFFVDVPAAEAVVLLVLVDPAPLWEAVPPVEPLALPPPEPDPDPEVDPPPPDPEPVDCGVDPEPPVEVDVLVREDVDVDDVGSAGGATRGGEVAPKAHPSTDPGAGFDPPAPVEL
jgi:hypothetical protein